MTKNNLQEKLVALYLRLNGYTTTGLILHSPNEEEVQAEIDLIGVRFKYHSQSDRLIHCADELQIPAESFIDIVICEVKGGSKPTLQFNESLKSHPERIKKMFEWIGISDNTNINELVKDFSALIQTKEIQKPDPFPAIHLDNITIRPLLFAPDRDIPARTQPNFIGGNKLMEFCWNCYRPEHKRETCSVNYIAINNWGEQFERLVGYFKDTNRTVPGQIADLYKHFDISD